MKLLLAFTIFLVAVSCIQEIKMTHKKRTPLEAEMFIAYMNRSPIIEGVIDTMVNLFPTNERPNLYSYPEVKIYNYLDAQYYG